MTIISSEQLASWLRDSSLEDHPSLIQIVDLVNDLIDEEWSDPEDPAPVRIQLLALGVASRAWTRNPATSHVESLTRTLDDGSRTERYRSTTSGDSSVFLTDAELAILHGEPTNRSLRLTIYGES